MFTECHMHQVRKIVPRPEAQRSFSRSPCHDVISSWIHEMSQIEDTKANSVNVGVSSKWFQWLRCAESLHRDIWVAHWTESTWEIFALESISVTYERSWLAWPHQAHPWFLNQSWIALPGRCLCMLSRKPLRMMYHALAEKQLPINLKVPFSSVAVAEIEQRTCSNHHFCTLLQSDWYRTHRLFLCVHGWPFCDWIFIYMFKGRKKEIRLFFFFLP